MAQWLLDSELDVFSYDDLARSRQQGRHGVRSCRLDAIAFAPGESR